MSNSMFNELKNTFRSVYDGAKIIKLDIGIKRFWGWVKNQWRK